MKLFSDSNISVAGIVRTGLLLAALAFIVAGVFRGEAAVVLQKAINICFECIGL